MGLEIMEDSPDVETIAVCVGGGGLLAGIAVAAKAIKPGVRIVGVEPEGAPVVTRSLVAGYPVTIEKITTVADGLAASFAAPTSQRLIERLVDDVVIVTDDEIQALCGSSWSGPSCWSNRREPRRPRRCSPARPVWRQDPG